MNSLGCKTVESIRVRALDGDSAGIDIVPPTANRILFGYNGRTGREEIKADRARRPRASISTRDLAMAWCHLSDVRFIRTIDIEESLPIRSSSD